MSGVKPDVPSSRAAALARLPRKVDLLVIGGGITGAGIALEAARRGITVLLVEARDFAWGTSSRSSKLVHGGLRYLKEGKPALTLESVRERNQLLRDLPGLVDPIGFVMAHHAGSKPKRATMRLGLALYDVFAGRRSSGYADAGELALLAPGIAPAGLQGASLYTDATTDDARLVLRVLAEAQSHGAVVCNYLAARSLRRDAAGQVCGALLHDTRAEAAGTASAAADAPADTPADIAIDATCTLAATGVWADQLRGSLGAAPMLRPLRGSHLLLPAWRLPLARAVAFLHPADARPVFAYPWQGTTLVGTTDLDHDDLAAEPAISAAELDYLLVAINRHFPALRATPADVLSTWAGVRPVHGSGSQRAPSQESRDHLVRNEHGLITVTGGKLTTFRRIARDALTHAAARLPGLQPARGGAIIPRHPVPAALASLPTHLHARLCARHGGQLAALLACAAPGELDCIAGTATLWAELRWAARSEQVQHLDDLLLRRTRLGLILAHGAGALLPRIEPIVRAELGWDDARWQGECTRYHALIARCYALPAAH